MGGKHQTTVQKKPKGITVQPQKHSKPRPRGKQEIRIHESGGDIHFHDDAAGLKAAVPVAQWWKAWAGLKSGDGDWTFVDTANSTLLAVAIQKISGVTEAIITIVVHVVETGDTFDALEDLTCKTGG